MVTIGFLHTAESHVRTFSDLLAAVDPSAVGAHVVDDSLLADARTDPAIGDRLRARLGSRLREAAVGADAVLCTCSTIGGAAELFGSALGAPVIRVDRPMAERAVELGKRLAVVAALESTVAPTRELLLHVAREKSAEVDLREVLCPPDAWTHFEAGDVDRYHRAVASTVDDVGSVDVIVLAQASMAGALSRCRTSLPVLSSPRLGVAAALAAATRR